ncbi:hypothetical protein HDK64DRAFT_262445 [Phyllosticta capitalensis]
MPPTWHFALDLLHPLSTAVRNRLGTTDRRLLARALHVAPNSSPNFPFLLRSKTTQGFWRPHLHSFDARDQSLDGIDNQSIDSTTTSALYSASQRAQSQKQKFQKGSRLDRLGQYIEKNAEGSELQGLYGVIPRRLTEARPKRESPPELLSLDDPAAAEAITRRSGAVESGKSIGFQQWTQENWDINVTGEKFPPSGAESPEQSKQRQAFGDPSQVDLTEDAEWYGISYAEAMESLEFEQIPAVTENSKLPDASSEAKPALEKNVDLSQSEQNTIEEAQTDVSGFKDQISASLPAQTFHSPEIDHTKAEQQGERPISGSETQQHITASGDQRSLVAALFPEMDSAPETEKRSAEQQEDLPKNPDDLVGALFPEMKSHSDTPSVPTQTTRLSAPKNQSELVDLLFPELAGEQDGNKPDVHQQDQPSKSSVGSLSIITAGENQQNCPTSAPELEATTRESVDQDLKYSDAIPENTNGLLHELFPEEANKNSQKEVKVDRRREPPRMRLDPAAGPRMSQFKSGENKLTREERTTVINLQAVSPRLTEEDIRGLLPPSSAHIEGWSSEYIKTIPLRDPITLDRKDAYYILFRSMHGAFQFKKRLNNLHDLLLKTAPTSMLSARTHPLDLTDPSTGEDMSHALKLFSLGPPSRAGHIFAPTLREPFPLEVARMIRNGGYPQVVDRMRGVEAKVLMHFDGMQPTKFEIVDAIRADGHDRSVMWDIPERGGQAIVPGVVQLSTARRDDAHSDVTSLMRKLPPRWLISFCSKPEAYRFVRRWHRRPFPWQPKEYAEYGEDRPIVKAEVLW